MRHEQRINSASFSPDGRWVITASSDDTACVWDPATGKPLSEPMQHGQWVSSASFSPDGTRVITASGDSTAKLWDIAIAGQTSPKWLAKLDEWSAEKRFGPHRATEPLGEERETLRAELENEANSLPAKDSQGRWLRWFLADPRTRTISPLSDETILEYVRRRVEENTPDSLREAVELDPNNALALARLGSKLVQNENARQEAWEIYANLYTLRAVQLAPQDIEVKKLRREVLDAIRKNSPSDKSATQSAFPGQ
jgi:WD40 repeat protein